MCTTNSKDDVQIQIKIRRLFFVVVVQNLDCLTLFWKCNASSAILSFCATNKANPFLLEIPDDDEVEIPLLLALR